MSLATRGYRVFAADAAARAWCAAARPAALAAVADPALRARWLRHGGTWFVGVDALDNDRLGRVGDGPPLGGAALAAAQALAGPVPLHRAQLSVTYPGYPAPDPGETAASARYRRDRDGAHLDGLLPEGPRKRRHLREAHAWILGYALSRAAPGAAPLVVYPGSHRLMRAAFRAAFAGRAPETWADLDVTEVYHDTRARVFETCPRITLPLRPGMAVLLHRMLLHGVAPWDDGAATAPEGRILAYFRPELPSRADWLDLP